MIQLAQSHYLTLLTETNPADLDKLTGMIQLAQSHYLTLLSLYDLFWQRIISASVTQLHFNTLDSEGALSSFRLAYPSEEIRKSLSSFRLAYPSEEIRKSSCLCDSSAILYINTYGVN
ncbi:hypothetical protein QE152_g5522 [Popillia japonica]|uniref:Uncharacterized protein n=1 Tax=Popillia japonica TaxID=7064 RepID=A0AAW1MIF6_POPJA